MNAVLFITGPFWHWLHDTSCSFWSTNIYEGLSKGKLGDDKGNTLRIMRFSLLVLFPKGYMYVFQKQNHKFVETAKEDTVDYYN